MHSGSDPIPTVLPAKRTGLAGFIQGAAAVWRGLDYMYRHPGLWRQSLWLVVLNLLITGLVLVLLIGGAVAFMIHLHPRFPADGTGLFLEILVALALLVAAVALALVVWQLLEALLCGYF